MPGSTGTPIMVCVLPELVWPYANTVPLKPPTTFSTMSLVVRSYTCGPVSVIGVAFYPASRRKSVLFESQWQGMRCQALRLLQHH